MQINIRSKQNQILCPKCFSRFSPDKQKLVCRSDGCSRKGLVFAPEEGQTLTSAQPVCVECGREIPFRLCPHCGFELTGMDSRSPVTPFSIVGAEGSGKSHYLAVMLHALRQEMTKVYGCSLYPMNGDGTLEQFAQQYHHPLFVEGKVISSTAQETVEPLIYSLVFPDGSRNGVTSTLTFYDACGANFTSGRELEENNRSVYNSKGILFLIDPTQFPAVRDRRKELGMQVCPTDPGDLLSRVIHLIRSGVGDNDITKKIDIPIAVCLSKMDILDETLDISSFVRNKPRHLDRPAFDPVDFESCSLEIQSLLESWSGKELVNQITAQFEHCGFFAFSALGGDPASDGTVERIAPHRTLDPVLWLMTQNKIIHTAR